MAEVCQAVRERDGAPCWMRAHVGRTHMTQQFEFFCTKGDAFRNVDLSSGDQLRDAPAALRS